MTGLGRRLRLLEASGGEECPECGLAPGAPFEPDEVLWHDTEEQDPAGPEWCSTCGRQTTYVVDWGDLGIEDPGEGGG